MQPFPNSGAAPEKPRVADLLRATHVVLSSKPINDNLVFYRQYPGKLELCVLYCPSLFKAGRFTLTQSSWTASTRRCSRKWMPGHADVALVSLRGRGQFATLTICPLGEPTPPSQGESPFPLDFYLSWMPTNCRAVQPLHELDGYLHAGGRPPSSYIFHLTSFALALSTS